VTNIRKHAEASRVSLALREEPGSVLLLVRDDGRGFVAEAPHTQGPATSFGLTGMSERASLIGGRLTVRSAPGDGTALELRIPKQPVEVAG
jgi:two-component system sensor histidine kinase UhpB